MHLVQYCNGFVFKLLSLQRLKDFSDQLKTCVPHSGTIKSKIPVITFLDVVTENASNAQMFAFFGHHA